MCCMQLAIKKQHLIHSVRKDDIIVQQLRQIMGQFLHHQHHHSTHEFCLHVKRMECIVLLFRFVDRLDKMTDLHSFTPQICGQTTGQKGRSASFYSSDLWTDHRSKGQICIVLLLRFVDRPQVKRADLHCFTPQICGQTTGQKGRSALFYSSDLWTDQSTIIAIQPKD